MKKKSVKESSRKTEQKPAPPTVRVVTEVVEELPEEPLEAIKQDAQNIEKTVEQLEEVVKEDHHENQGKSKREDIAVVTLRGDDEPKEGLSEVDPSAESHKVVVEKLFKQEAPSFASEISIHERGNPMKSVFVWVFTVVFVALLTGGGLLLLVKGLPAFSSISFLPKPMPTPIPSPTPTPTPIAIKREEIKTQVLNGGGNPGAGSTMKKLLESKGYTVVEVGNTPEYTYDKTEIVIKAGSEGALNLLKSDLRDTYSLQDSTDSVPSDASYDARVIVGKQ